MVIKNIDFEKYNKMAEKSFYRKLGKVVNVVGLTIESAGPDSKLGDLCRILPDAEGARPIMAEVVGFRDKKTLLMPYDSVDGIGLGCVVENTGDPLKVTVNDKLLGKTVNGLGVPIDGEMINGAAYPVEAAPPDPMSRTIIDQVLPLGVKAVDGRKRSENWYLCRLWCGQIHPDGYVRPQYQSGYQCHSTDRRARQRGTGIY